MSEAQQTDLTSLNSLENAARKQTLPAYIERLLEAAQADSVPEQAAVLRTIAAALQIDLAYLRNHPEELFPALYMRCGLHDTADGESLGAPGPNAPTGGALSTLAQRWRSEYEQRGRPWLQSMLPPEHEPGGPMLAELRLSSDWHLCSMDSDGDVYVHKYASKRGHPHLRWCVRTGELVKTDATPCKSRPRHASLQVKGESEDAKLYDSAQGIERPLSIPEHGLVTSHTFSMDGKFLVICGYVDMYVCGFLQVYETATARLLHDFETHQSFGIDRPIITACGRYVMALNHEGLHLWDLKKLRKKPPREKKCSEIFPLQGDAEVEISPDGRRLAVRNAWQVVRLFDLADVRAITKRLSRTHSVHFSPDGRRVLVGTWLCEGLTGRRLRPIKVPEPKWRDERGDPRNSFCFGTARIVILHYGVHVWNSETGVRRRGPRKKAPAERYAEKDVVVITRDGRCYAVQGDGTYFDRNPDYGEYRAAMRAGDEAAVARLLQGRSDDRPVHLRDSDTGAVRATFPAQDVTVLSFSPDERLLAIGTRHGIVELWDVATSARVSAPKAHASEIVELRFSADGQLLVSAGEHEALRVSRVADGAEVAARPLGKQDPAYQRSMSAQKMPIYETRLTWRPSDKALQELHTWVGFALPPPPPPPPRYSAEVKEGVTCIRDGATKAPLARLPHEGPWATHPDAPIWAGPFAHLYLRGVA